jgi:hypothetical protein
VYVNALMSLELETEWYFRSQCDAYYRASAMKKIPIECIRPGHAWAFSCRCRRSCPLYHHHHRANHLPQPPGLTLRLEQAEDVVLADCPLLAVGRTSGCRRAHTWALDVADDASGGVVHELDAALGDATAGAWPSQNSVPRISCPLLCIRRRRTGAAENAGDLDELDGDLCGIHCERLRGSALAARGSVFRGRPYCEKACDGWVVGGPGVVLGVQVTFQRRRGCRSK